jgi:hypothetical protein
MAAPSANAGLESRSGSVDDVLPSPVTVPSDAKVLLVGGALVVV